MTTWTMGSATITRVEEQLGITNQPCEKYFRNFERDVLERHLDWLAPDHYSPQHDRFVTSVHSWLIRSGDLTILLDTCGGNHKDRPWTHRFHQLDTPYLERLRAAGAAPEDVDMVFARICMPTMSAGIRCCATGAGCRLSRTQSTCSRAPMTPTGTYGRIR